MVEVESPHASTACLRIGTASAYLPSFMSAKPWSFSSDAFAGGAAAVVVACVVAGAVSGWVVGAEGFSPMMSNAIVLAEVLDVVWMSWLAVVAWRMDGKILVRWSEFDAWMVSFRVRRASLDDIVDDVMESLR